MNAILTNSRQRLRLLFLVLLLSGPTYTQAQMPANMQKPYSGVYSKGVSIAIYLFDDGRFALIGYATFLRGNYKLRGKAIHMEVDKPSADFMILGRKEPALKGKTKLTFNSSFAGVPALIQFDDQPVQLIFDETTNYLRSQYEVIINQRPGKFALTLPNPEKPVEPNTVVFSPPAAFNDFLLLCNEPSDEEPFYDGTFGKEDGETVLKFGGETLYKDTDDTEMLDYVQEAMANEKLHANDSLLYFNDQLKVATGYDELSEAISRFSPGNYILDSASNKLIRRENYIAGKDYTRAVAKNYHDETYMLQYQVVPPLRKTRAYLPKQISKLNALMKAEKQQ